MQDTRHGCTMAGQCGRRAPSSIPVCLVVRWHYIVVAFEILDEREPVIRSITAFEPDQGG